MKTPRQIILSLVGLLAAATHATAQTSMDTYLASTLSWLTNSARQYARIRTNHSATTLTTWTNEMVGSPQFGACQCLPVYADIHWLGYALAEDSFYVSAPGLPSYTMGPWYLNTAETMLFPNLPLNQYYVASFPRHPERISALLTRSNTPVDIAGMFVNGTAVFNMLDGYYYWRTGDTNPNHGYDTNGVMTWRTGVWHRSAYPSEQETFDVNNSHQSKDGQIHLHINPSGLRLQLSDNVLALVSLATGEITKIFERSDTNHHSPILGWAFDGFPIYGPYGYSIATNARSPVRRMISGYVLRDGGYGTTNLNVTGRTSLPLWAMEVQGRTTTVLTNAEWGPSTNKVPFPDYALGRYAEDYEHLDDLPRAATVGVPWDLDRCNQRFCVTPEFPNGIWAYFVTIDSNGVPVFPFILGPQYCGKVLGGSGGTVPDGTTEIFDLYNFGVHVIPPVVRPLPDGILDILLSWSSYEGGQYRLLGSDDFQTWTPSDSSVMATGATTRVRFTQAAPQSRRQFWRVVQESLAPYDPDQPPLPTILSVVPNSAPGGSTLPVNITLSQKPLPPAGLPAEVHIGNAPGSNVQREGNVITATFHFVTGPPRTVDVVVTFNLPQPPGGTITYTLPNGFTIN